ncbi:glycosyltransferase [Tieghemostelium lacteum]|uniref:Mannosyltransferase n=1 Tax=Tieghemostelium lacteum TaxID=361077 RepID=A0A151Z2K0_TIELA|nr:glycosyltransferase [Tieghemostelium lacteum]|eukprot:KYQ88183.1 glycosyltransferase [Tieghemostelium lacteum]
MMKTIILFLILFISTIISSFYNRIMDCDEYMNYWEPTHFLMYNKGFQTWEYSPKYSLRSYAYLMIYSTIGKLVRYFIDDKITIFFLLKIFIGLGSSISQFIFYLGVLKQFGREISNYTYLFMLISPGFFLSTSTLLPTTFSMCLLMIAYGCLLLGYNRLSVITGATSVFLGWPFVILLLLPLALIVLARKGFLNTLMDAIVSIILVLLPMLLIDYHYYGKPVLAILNIIMYNLTSNHSGGSQLYGIEPWYFYIQNSIVNFNVVFLLSLFTPLLLIGGLWRNSKDLSKHTLIWIFTIISPFYIWFLFMSYLPHKEERFLFCIYPFLCLCGSITLVIILNSLNNWRIWMESNYKKTDKPPPTSSSTIKILKLIRSLIWFTVLTGFILLSISRISSTYINYDAPIQSFKFLNNYLEEKYLNNIKDNNNNTTQSINICIGKEWHRYPSNYFIPQDTSNIHFNLRFIESQFKGHLPKPFDQTLNATRIIPTNMNDQNKQEMDRYVNINECNYLVDSDIPNQSEERYSIDSNNWKIISNLKYFYQSPHPIFRAFYIPFYSNRNQFYDYYVLESKIL